MDQCHHHELTVNLYVSYAGFIGNHKCHISQLVIFMALTWYQSIAITNI